MRIKFYKIIIIGLQILILFNFCSNTKNHYLGNDVQKFKNTPAWKLAKAIKRQDTNEIKKNCLKNKSLINYQEKKQGMSLLHFAVFSNKFYSTRTLLELGANPNILDSSGENAFLQAAANPDTSVYLELLLKYGGKVNIVGDCKNSLTTPLMSAVLMGNLQNVKILVEAGADINYKPCNFNSAVIAACRSERMEIIRYLIIDNGADINQIAGHYVDEFGHLDSVPYHIVDLFRDMLFPLNSNDYKIKMEIVKFMKTKGVDYWKTPIPKDYYEKYDSIYLSKY